MRQIYLNNRDLLSQIHKSKNTYCSFKNPETDHQFDLILRDKNCDPKPFWPKLTDIKRYMEKNASASLIKEAKQTRVDRINKLNGKEATQVTLKDIPNTDLVFRVMTFEHIPLAPPKQPKNKGKTKSLIEEIEIDDLEPEELIPELVTIDPLHVKVNFPPFYHYKLDDQNKFYLVGKSHWSGPLDTGHFSREHGNMTRELAQMFIKLCERYGTRANWRNYTYNDEMRGQALLQLSQIGLQFDESKSQNPFAYYTAAITNSFTRVFNIEKRNQNIRDDILEMNDYNPSYTRQNGSNSGHGADE